MWVRGTRCQGNAFLPIASPLLGSDGLRVRSGNSSSSCNGHILPSNAHQAARGVGGFHGVQFTVVALYQVIFGDSFTDFPGKKGTYLRPMHPRSKWWKTQVVWSSKDETCGSFAESLSSSQRLVVRLSCPEELFEH